eukprot:39627_1
MDTEVKRWRNHREEIYQQCLTRVIRIYDGKLDFVRRIYAGNDDCDDDDDTVEEQEYNTNIMEENKQDTIQTQFDQQRIIDCLKEYNFINENT